MWKFNTHSLKYTYTAFMLARVETKQHFHCLCAGQVDRIHAFAHNEDKKRFAEDPMAVLKSEQARKLVDPLQNDLGDVGGRPGKARLKDLVPVCSSEPADRLCYLMLNFFAFRVNICPFPFVLIVTG